MEGKCIVELFHYVFCRDRVGAGINPAATEQIGHIAVYSGALHISQKPILLLSHKSPHPGSLCILGLWVCSLLVTLCILYQILTLRVKAYIPENFEVRTDGG